MIKKYHWVFRLTTGLIALLSLICFAAYFKEPSILFTAFLLYVLGTLCTIKGRDYQIFQSAYSWMMVFCIIQASYFFSQYGHIFDRGGDDQYFFNDWIIPGVDDIGFVLDEFNPYKTFVLPAVYYYKFIDFIGIGSLFSFHVNLLNVFIAAFIPVFVYRVALRYFSGKTAQMASCFVIFYPFLSYHSVKVMRDVHVYLLFTIAVYVLISHRRMIYQILLMSVILLLIANVRKEALLYFMALIGGYGFFTTKKVSSKVLILAGVAVAFAGAYAYVNIKYGLDFASISRFSQLYDELRQDTDTGNSLATALKNAGFLGKVISTPYIWLSPLPPPVLVSFDIMSVMVSLGCLCWYFLFPRGVIQIYESARYETNSDKKALTQALILTLITSSLFISYTSGDPRHILVFFPIFVIFSIGYYEKRSTKYELNVNYIMIVLLLFGVFGYIYLKFLR